METAAMGGRTGTHEQTLDSGSSMRRRYYRGPWQIRGLGSSYGRPLICSTLCPKNSTHTSSEVRRPESGTWQSVAMETAAMGGRTGTH
ncbi:unnamed protein product, partial [Staurois parvus]